MINKRQSNRDIKGKKEVERGQELPSMFLMNLSLSETLKRERILIESCKERCKGPGIAKKGVQGAFTWERTS